MPLVPPCIRKNKTMTQNNMARDHKCLQAPSLVLCITFPLLLLASYHIHPCNALYQNGSSKSKAKVKGMFVFGTSVVDDGNNNNIFTSGKANYEPYGIDFPLGPTGRFSNGKTVADRVGDLLGLPLIPPFADPQTEGEVILHGVNFGSAGSGILDETGVIEGNRFSLNEQIRNFEEVTLLELRDQLRNKSTNILDGYLFLVASGNNDFLLNYLIQPEFSRPTVPAFVTKLTSTYASQLQKLYNVGARKFVLLTVYPLGCSPVVKKIASDGQKCVETVNEATHYFYKQLIRMVDGLNERLPGSKFVVVNSYKIIIDIIRNPNEKGFINGADPCCELLGVFGVGLSCREGGNVCEDRNRYVYFDGQHNTEGVNAIIAKKAFSSNLKTEVYPFNLKQLIKY